jgi:TolB protein
MRIQTRFIAVAVFILFSFELPAQFKVNVDQGELSDYAMAVSPLNSSDKKLASELTKAVTVDLKLSGYFHLLNPKSFLEKSDVKVDKIDFKNWLNVGAQGLIKGSVTVDKQVSLELMFFNVADGKKLLHKKYTSSKKAIRKGVHSFVKEVVKQLTGEELKFLTSKLAFIEKSKGRYSLVTADFDGANRKVLYSSKSIILLPEWSKDGKKIYYTSYKSGNPYLYSFDLKTGKSKVVSSHSGLNTSASSHPDNEHIALRLSKDGNAEIYLLNTLNKKLVRLTKSMAIDTAPSFSPDGKEIAFVSNRSGTPQIYRLFTHNPSRVERLTVQGRYNQDPDYSPDGKHIAFTGRDEHYMFDIFLFDVKSRVISRVTQKQGKNENPTFSPGGKLLLFTSNRRGKNALYISNLKGDKQLRIYSSKSEIVTPSWSPESVTSK